MMITMMIVQKKNHTGRAKKKPFLSGNKSPFFPTFFPFLSPIPPLYHLVSFTPARVLQK